MKSSHGIYLPIILVLIGIIFILRECDGPDKHNCDPDVIIETRIDTIPGDSVPYKVEVKVPVPYKVLELVTVPTVIDTMAILQDYFKTYFYQDTITDDTSMMVILSEKISQNRVIEREVQFQNLREISIVTNKVFNKKRNKVYAGLSIGGNATAMNFGPSLLFQNKKDHIYGYHYEFSQKTHNFSLYFKIKLRKNEKD